MAVPGVAYGEWGPSDMAYRMGHVLGLGEPAPAEQCPEMAAKRERVAVAMASLDGPEAGSFLLTVVDAGGETVFEGRYAFDPESLPAEFAAGEMEAAAAPFEPGPPDGRRNPRATHSVPVSR